jgi:hypothetical protein
MLILCHGNVVKGKDNKMMPCTPYMTFFDDMDDLILQKAQDITNLVVVHAKEGPTDPRKAPRFKEVSMLQVTHNAEMCIVMCCYAGRIVDAHVMSDEAINFFAREGAPKREYFYSDDDDTDGGSVQGYSIEILIPWIINLVDCGQVYDNEPVCVLWRTAMLRIMQTVKVFGSDNKGFFKFLCAVGLTVEMDEVCNKMKMRNPHPAGEQPDTFVVGGHKMTWITSTAIDRLLPQFKRLKLRTVDPAMTQSVTCVTPELSPKLVLSSDPDVDTFLKTYTATERDVFGDSDSESEVKRELRSDSDSDSDSTSLRTSGTTHKAVPFDLTQCLQALRAMHA